MRRRTTRKKSSGSLVAFGAAPAKRGNAWVAIVLGALVVVNLYVFVWDKDTSYSALKNKAEEMQPAALPSSPLAAAALPAAPAPGGEVRAPVAPPGAVDGKVNNGDTVGRLLKRSGLSGPETDEVIRALTALPDFKTNSLRPGQKYHLERGPDGHVKSFTLVLNKLQTIHVDRAPTGELVGKFDAVSTRVEVKALGGRIESSLYAAIKAGGESGGLVDFFVDVFAYDLDFFNDTHDGDTFRVVVEKELKEGGDELLRYKRILAAEYQGKAGTFRVFAFNDGYYTEDGESSEKTFLKTPLKFHRISSGFDRKRMHPVLHVQRAHLGIDYAAPVGTPVWAAAGGKIVHRGPAGPAGNLVILRHDDGIETAYMHLSKFADAQKVGETVKAKTVIGFVGTTGRSTGPHLHFGVRKNGEYIDPTKLAPIKGKGISGKDMNAFRTEVERLQGLLGGVKITT